MKFVQNNVEEACRVALLLHGCVNVGKGYRAALLPTASVAWRAIVVGNDSGTGHLVAVHAKACSTVCIYDEHSVYPHFVRNGDTQLQPYLGNALFFVDAPSTKISWHATQLIFHPVEAHRRAQYLHSMSRTLKDAWGIQLGAFHHQVSDKLTALGLSSLKAMFAPPTLAKQLRGAGTNGVMADAEQGGMHNHLQAMLNASQLGKWSLPCAIEHCTPSQSPTNYPSCIHADIPTLVLESDVGLEQDTAHLFEDAMQKLLHCLQVVDPGWDICYLWRFTSTDGGKSYGPCHKARHTRSGEQHMDVPLGAGPLQGCTMHLIRNLVWSNGAQAYLLSPQGDALPCAFVFGLACA